MTETNRLRNGRPKAVAVLSLGLAVLLAVLWATNPIGPFIVKAFFAALTYTAATWTMLVLGFRRRAVFAAAIGLIVLTAVTALTDSSGSYDPQSYHSWRRLEAGQIIKARIFTYPDSPKWKKIPKSLFTPYLYLSITKLQDGDEILIGIDGEPPRSLTDMPGYKRVSNGYAIPLSRELVRAKEFLDVSVEVVRANKLFVFTAPWKPGDPRRPPQTITAGGKTEDVPKALKNLCRFVIEIRFADVTNHVAAVLY